MKVGDKMNYIYDNTAQIIFKECIRWVDDFIEGEISFSIMLLNFEQSYRKLSHFDNIDLQDLLTDLQELTLLEIHNLIEEKVVAIHESREIDSDNILQNKLLEIINAYHNAQTN